MYKPNFNDPRVIRRITQAITWANGISKKTRSFGKLYIDQQLGHSGRPLGQWLRQHLLITLDDYYNKETGVCKKYKINPKGIEYLKGSIGLEAIPIDTRQVDQWSDQIESGIFLYDEKSNRRFHPLQYIPKVIKQPGMAQRGLKHNYDIVAAAPTLLLQHAKHLGMNKPTPYLDLYLQNRTQVREFLSQQYKIDRQLIKKTINGLLQGGRLSHWHQSKILRDLGNHSYITALRSDQYIQGLVQDIKVMWQTLQIEIPRTSTTTRNGTQRKRAITSSQKSDKYRQLERQVIKVVEKYLKKHNNKCFFEHDGWTCETAVDLIELRTCVRTQTGFEIEFDWSVYETA